MALRIMLVAVVAALGLDLADFEEVASWGDSGRDWVAARMADLASLGVEAGSATDKLGSEPIALAEAGSGRADLAFEVVCEVMAAGFASDLASMTPMPPVAESLASVEPEADPAPVAVPTGQDPRLEKINAAVRLTRQAVDAWASLIQPTAGTDQADSF